MLTLGVQEKDRDFCLKLCFFRLPFPFLEPHQVLSKPSEEAYRALVLESRKAFAATLTEKLQVRRLYAAP